LIFKPLALPVVLDPKLYGRYLPTLSPPAPPGVLKPPPLAVDRLLVNEKRYIEPVLSWVRRLFLYATCWKGLPQQTGKKCRYLHDPCLTLDLVSPEKTEGYAILKNLNQVASNLHD